MALKEKAEIHLGEEISDEEFRAALEPAENKLHRINERYGTNHGEDYLAMLIYEQVLFNRISHFCNAINRGAQAEKKEDVLLRDTSSTPHHNYNRRGILCQEVF